MTFDDDVEITFEDDDDNITFEDLNLEHIELEEEPEEADEPTLGDLAAREEPESQIEEDDFEEDEDYDDDEDDFEDDDDFDDDFDEDEDEELLVDEASDQVAELERMIADTEDEDYKTLVQFNIKPEVLQNALKEVRSNIKLVSDVLYFCVSDDDDSDLYEDNMIAPEAGRGRLVIGGQGSGSNLVFVDVPIENVAAPGFFLIDESDKLSAWASACEKEVTIQFIRDLNDKTHLGLFHDTDYNKLPIHVFYIDDDIAMNFPGVVDRFDTPEEMFSNKRLKEMLARAEKLAPAGAEVRTGDMLWYSESVEEDTFTEGAGAVEFITADRQDQHTIATVQKVRHSSEFNFEWEMTPEHLKALNHAMKMDNTTYAFVESEILNDDGDIEDIRRVLQLAYYRSVDKEDSRNVYVHRQLSVDRENSTLKTWSGEDNNDGLIFEHTNSKVFVTVPSNAFFNATKRAWGAAPSAMLKLERAADEAGEPILSMLSGDPTDPNVNEVSAIHGDSELEHFLFHPSVRQRLETLIGDAAFFQIRSFPNPGEDEELENVMIIAPVLEGEDPNEPNNAPDRYMLVSWI